MDATFDDSPLEPWLTLEAETLFDNGHVRVDAETLKTPSRPRIQWTTVHRRAAIVVAPRTVEGKWVLIQEERPPVRRLLWTFPAGQVDALIVDEDSLRETVYRELAEETGYAPANACLTDLGLFYSSPGFTSESLQLYLLDPVAVGEQGSSPESSECIAATREVSSAELTQLVATGVIADGPSLSLYARLQARQLL